MFEDLKKQLKENIVDCSKGNFEEHPESYSPRIFVAIAETDDLNTPSRVYELLRDGKAIIWPSTPPPGSIDFWVILANHLSDINMMHHGRISHPHGRPNVTEPAIVLMTGDYPFLSTIRPNPKDETRMFPTVSDPGGLLCGGLMKRGTQYEPVNQPDGFATDHLPEGAH